MSTPRMLALGYLRTPPGALWRWEEDGRVLVWKDGTTIAFREEVDAMIAALAPGGLPPFEAIVLLLAACRGRTPQPADVVRPNFNEAGRAELMLTLLARNHQQACDELRAVARLPAPLLKDAKGKALLAEAVFELAKRENVAASAQIAAALAEETFGGSELATPPSGALPVDLTRALWMVVEGLRRHTGDSLQRRLRTGLDALPQAADAIPLPAEVRARNVLAELARSEEHAGLALVARDLMAAIRLPQVVAQVDELALGGASGLGNRGSLDRLLISELAQDDLVLATRVALNEALYLQREPPALTPERGLVVVLDAGLRMWGVPRVIAAAATLGLLAGHRGTGAARVWRAEGNAVVPVKFDSKDDLEKHFAVLRAELDPRAALPALHRKLAEDAADADATDVVLVVHADALRDETFQARLAPVAATLDRGFLLLVDHDGAVELHAMPWGSPRPLAQSHVEVDKLFTATAAKKPAVPLVEPMGGRDLPAAFREPLFPLLLPVGSTQMVVPVGKNGGGLAVTKDKRLMHWDGPGVGACQLAADLPSGQTRWLYGDENGRSVVVKFHSGRSEMVVVIVAAVTALAGATTKQVRFSSLSAPSAIYVEHDIVFFVLKSTVVALGLDAAEVLVETPIPSGMSWHEGRYFFGEGGLSYAFWSGAGVRWDLVAAGRNLRSEDVLLAFDREGVGAYVLMRDGRLLSPTGTQLIATPFPISHVFSNRNHARLHVVRASDKSTHALVVAPNGVWSLLMNLKNRFPYDAVATPSLALRHNFNAIWGEPGQPLRLGSTKGRWYEFADTTKRLHLAFCESGARKFETDGLRFSSVLTPAFLGCSLSVATWPGGSKAWLDSRGLLHLRSSDPSLPQITLALHEPHIAAWTSDHQIGGPEFCTGRKTSELTSTALMELLTKFCDRLC